MKLKGKLIYNISSISNISRTSRDRAVVRASCIRIGEIIHSKNISVIVPTRLGDIYRLIYSASDAHPNNDLEPSWCIEEQTSKNDDKRPF